MKTIVVFLTFICSLASFTVRPVSFDGGSVTIKSSAPNTFRIKHYSDKAYFLKSKSLRPKTMQTCSASKWSHVKLKRAETTAEQSFNHPLTLYVTKGEASIQQEGRSFRLKKGQSCPIPPSSSFTLKNNSSAKTLRIFTHNSYIDK